MKTITTADLKTRKRGGAKVKPPPAPAPVLDKEKQIESTDSPASMRASMKHLEEQAEATRIVMAMNAEAIAGFKESMESLVGELQERPEPVIAEARELPEYTFDLERDQDTLLKRVYARPGILK